MSDRPKKCCKCGKIVARIIIGETISKAEVKRVNPFVISGGKYWCKECFDKENKR